jgi:hypothetical protein
VQSIVRELHNSIQGLVDLLNKWTGDKTSFRGGK